MTRKTLSLILLGALIFLSAQGIFSCRSIKKSHAKTDSTATRSEQSSLAWQSETVTEISLAPDQLLPYIQGDSLLPFPDIFTAPIQPSKGLLARLGISGKHAQRIAKKRPAGTTHALISAPARLILRKTEKQSGQLDQKKEEQTHVQTRVRNSYKEPNVNGLLSVWFAAFVLLFIFCLWVKSQLKS